MVPRQWSHDHGETGLKQRRLVSRWSTGHIPYVSINCEIKIIDPHRTSAARRCVDQTLPQPRQGQDAVRNQLPKLLQAEVAGSFQDQDDRELLRHCAGVDRQECRSAELARSMNEGSLLDCSACPRSRGLMVCTFRHGVQEERTSAYDPRGLRYGL